MKSPSGSFEEIMEMTLPLMEGGPPRGCRLAGLLSGARSHWLRLKGALGARRGIRGRIHRSPGNGRNIYPLTSQGPSFFWQFSPEKPGAQVHW